MSKLLRKGMISLVVILSLVITPVIHPQKTAEAAGDTGSWTVAVYMCGSNLESGHYSASSDIIEMLDVKTMPDSVNVIIETGGSPRWFFKELATSPISSSLFTLSLSYSKLPLAYSIAAALICLSGR